MVYKARMITFDLGTAFARFQLIKMYFVYGFFLFATVI